MTFKELLEKSREIVLEKKPVPSSWPKLIDEEEPIPDIYGALILEKALDRYWGYTRH